MYNDDGKIEDGSKFIKLPVQALSNQFLNNVGPLHLNDFGYVQKIVHFTAQNEHRVNFDLTRMLGANVVTRIVEKNFPGVHCDIGGAYENENEEKEQIETSKYVSDLEERMEQLIDEYWFKDEQLDIDGQFFSFITKALKYGTLGVSKPIQTYKKMNGIRKNLRKEYSYIPLHFMEEYTRTTAMEEYITSKTEDKYPIDSDAFLLDVRKHLWHYAFDNTGEVSEWKFKTDKEIQEENELKIKKRQAEKELKHPELSHRPVHDGINPNDYKPDVVLPKDKNTPVEQEVTGKDDIHLETDPDAIQLDEVVVQSFNSQNGLRKLRNEYLHWSSSRKWFGMEPHVDRKRREH